MRNQTRATANTVHQIPKNVTGRTSVSPAGFTRSTHEICLF